MTKILYTAPLAVLLLAGTSIASPTMFDRPLVGQGGTALLLGSDDQTSIEWLAQAAYDESGARRPDWSSRGDDWDDEEDAHEVSYDDDDGYDEADDDDDDGDDDDDD